MFDASSERVPDQRYRGMNPEFVKAVWAKRRAALPRQKPGPKPMTERKIEQPKLVQSVAQPLISTEVIVANFRVIVPGISPMSKLKGKDIIKRVCWEYEMDVASVLGTSRNKKVVKVRQLAMVAVRRLRPDLHLTDIGRLFNRDHTTVLHSLKKHGVWHGDTQQAA